MGTKKNAAARKTAWTSLTVYGVRGGLLRSKRACARRLLLLRAQQLPGVRFWFGPGLSEANIDWTGIEEAARSKHRGGDARGGPSAEATTSVYLSPQEKAELEAVAAGAGKAGRSAGIRVLLEERRKREAAGA